MSRFSKAQVKPQVVVIFGEHDNDRRAIQHLVAAAAPHAPACRLLGKPLVLIRGREAAAAHKNAAELGRRVRAQQVRDDVRAVIAHQDCDALEPAHVTDAEEIERRLAQAGAPQPIAATPAWETETWLFLWPAAAAAVCQGWAGRLDRYKGRDLGRIENAKEELKKALKPGRSGEGREYRESDAPDIAANVGELGLIDQRAAKSASFEHFLEKVRSAAW